MQLYSDKTTKKAASGPETPEEKKARESFYVSQKQLLNSSFGACCTNIIKSTVEYKDNEWAPIQRLTDEVIKEKLDAEREKKQPLFAYQHGVWITAVSRRHLFKMIMQMDDDATVILRRMEEYGGKLPFTDKASPAVIKRETGLSKNAFKRAVGRLYKERRVEITERAIRKI